MPAGAPLAGALRLTVHFLMPIPQRASAAQRDGAAHVSKPDADNLAKLVLDVLSRLGWWGDDAQVSTLIAHKRYSVRPGVFVRLDHEEAGA
jgi:Holliday junction resolvase RusA-like endonuclease